MTPRRPSPQQTSAGDSGNTLLPQHAALLEASAISPEVAQARGYRSVTNAAKLASLGFNRAQQRVPALLIPVWNVHGELALHQLRPDQPRIKDGKAVKYETPVGTRMVIDVPPAVRALIGDPSQHLLITEGIRKADAAVSKDFCCIALLGVWNWRGRNEFGGKTALADWESIALNGRRVHIVYDSDTTQKPGVRLALDRLRLLLTRREAHVKVVKLPAGPNGAKVGLDDYLAAGNDLAWLLMQPEAEEFSRAVVAQPPTLPYEATPHGFIYTRRTRDADVRVRLTNFTAEILTDIAEDDGAEVHHVFKIEARLGDDVRGFSLSARQFQAMQWPIEHLGAHAIVYPGFGFSDHARVAIQSFIRKMVKERVYTHTGWSQIDGVWVYLHAGGAIGPAGVIGGVQVRLSGTLSRYALPTPPTGDELITAIRASLKLIDAGPDRVTLLIYAAMARAALATADFSVHLAGPTGAGKTAVAVLALQHFGAAMDAAHMPASWFSTANALEGLAFLVKDALLLVDDFAPTGSQADVQRFHRDADRVLRAQGNNTGRQRMRPDGSLREPKPPRGLILSTGEDVPRGQSLRARILVSEMGRTDLDWEQITRCQEDAQDGLFAQALAGFVRWLSPRYEQVRATLRSELSQWRQRAEGGAVHRRLPTTGANLLLGLKYWLQYAEESGALSRTDADDLWARGQDALAEAARAQEQHHLASNPVERYLELLKAAIASGAAHIADPEGREPEMPEAWGWRSHTVVVMGSVQTEWRSYGDRIGWVDDADLYLEPQASYTVVQRLAQTSGEPITVGVKTLHKRLHEAEVLASVDSKRKKLTVRRPLAGQRRAVLHLRARTIAVTQGPNGPTS